MNRQKIQKGLFQKNPQWYPEEEKNPQTIFEKNARNWIYSSASSSSSRLGSQKHMMEQAEAIIMWRGENWTHFTGVLWSPFKEHTYTKLKYKMNIWMIETKGGKGNLMVYYNGTQIFITMLSCLLVYFLFIKTYLLVSCRIWLVNKNKKYQNLFYNKSAKILP